MSADLGARAVACKGWRWMPGMRALHKFCSAVRVLVSDDGEDEETLTVRPGPDGNEVQCASEWGVIGMFGETYGGEPFRPDLDDHATLGCIEHGLLPEAWPGCWISVTRYTTGPDGDPLGENRVRADVLVQSKTREIGQGPEFGVADVPLAEALVACLEASPANQEVGR